MKIKKITTIIPLLFVLASCGDSEVSQDSSAASQNSSKVPFKNIPSRNTGYKLGVDYGALSRPLPVKQDGIVEVVEIFWYACGHCFSLEPVIGNWASKQGNSVNFKKMPVTWGEPQQLHAKLFLYHRSLRNC